jgi:hypothetical protein
MATIEEPHRLRLTKAEGSGGGVGRRSPITPGVFAEITSRVHGRSTLAANAASSKAWARPPEHGGTLRGTGLHSRRDWAQRRLWVGGAGDLVAKRGASTNVTGLLHQIAAAAVARKLTMFCSRLGRCPDRTSMARA